MKSSKERWSSSNFHFSFLIPQWGIRIKEECFKRKLVNSSGPLATTLCRKADLGGTGTGMMVGGVMAPAYTTLHTQKCSYLQGKVGADRNDRGRGE